MMDMITALNQRRSVKADLLVEPAPRGEDLRQILQAGMSAPDHGAVRPWRFTIIDGDDRFKLGDIFAEALQQDKPESSKQELDDMRRKPLRAPLLVAIWAEIHENHPKVPPVEQIIATSCAAENILLAAQAKSYGIVLLTGWPAFHGHVKKSLGMKNKDQMIGFLYLGSASETPRQAIRPNVQDFLRNFP